MKLPLLLALALCGCSKPEPEPLTYEQVSALVITSHPLAVVEAPARPAPGSFEALLEAIEIYECESGGFEVKCGPITERFHTISEARLAKTNAAARGAEWLRKFTEAMDAKPQPCGTRIE